MLKKIFVALLLIILVAGGKPFLEWKNSLVFNWQERLGWPVWFFRGLFLRSDLAKQISRLTLENRLLVAQVMELARPPAVQGSYYRAKIYSSYPLNHRGFFVINAGDRQGIKELRPVTAGGHILIGQVAKVFDNYSQVRSIFSPDWQMPVRIGEEEADALLTGGPDLKISLVVAEKLIKEGQAIVSASEQFPYGLLIGEVENIVLSPDGIFKEAQVGLPYNFNQLTEAWVILDF